MGILLREATGRERPGRARSSRLASSLRTFWRFQTCNTDAFIKYRVAIRIQHVRLGNRKMHPVFLARVPAESEAISKGRQYLFRAAINASKTRDDLLEV